MAGRNLRIGVTVLVLLLSVAIGDQTRRLVVDSMRLIAGTRVLENPPDLSIDGTELLKARFCEPLVGAMSTESVTAVVYVVASARDGQLRSVVDNWRAHGRQYGRLALWLLVFGGEAQHLVWTAAPDFAVCRITDPGAFARHSGIGVAPLTLIIAPSGELRSMAPDYPTHEMIVRVIAMFSSGMPSKLVLFPRSAASTAIISPVKTDTQRLLPVVP